MVPAEPTSEGDGPEEGGRPGILGLHRLHCEDPHPHLRPAPTFYPVQGWLD